MRMILLLIGALATLSLGAVGASAAPRETAPCHQTGGSAPDHPQPAKAMKAMACCMACVTAPTPAPPAEIAALRTAASVAPAESRTPPGRRLTPEPAPPRA